MPTYVRLLGTPAIKFDGEWIVPPTTKLSALLYYLAHKEHWVDRSVLTYLFWSDIPEENARNNLRKLLSRSKDLPYTQNLDVERTRLRWVTDTDLKVFQEALEAQDPSQTVRLYSGELLEGFRLDSAPEFDAWLETERQEVFNAWRETVFQLTSALESKGQYSNIADALEKLHKADPFDEDVLKHYLRSLHLDNQKSKALEIFKQFEKTLKEELGGEPESATLELVEYIRKNDAPTPTTAKTISSKAISPPNFLELDSLSLESKTPVFVARQQEMSKLNSYLDKLLDRQHQVAFVLGEAGQGKSSLLQAFSQQVQKNRNFTVVSGNCNAYTGIGDPYLPFREILELLTGDVQARAEVGELNPDSAKSLWETLPIAIEAIMSCGPDLLDTFISTRGLISRGVAHSPQGAPWLSELREIVSQKSNQPSQVQQSALFEQYAKVIQVLANKAPLLLLLDDVQWIDTGSANLFLHLVKRLKSYPVLIIGAYRPSEVGIGRDGERHPLEQVINECQRVFGEISIDLSQVAGKTFIDELIDAEPNKLDNTFRDTMLKQTGGHPLFTVELLRSLKEREDIVKEDGHWVEKTNIDWKAMPALVEGVIGERIGRLPAPLRELLQVASVEGEEFSAEVVAEVLGLDRREAVRQLSRELDKAHYLVKAQGIKREGTVKLSRYRFQHILIQRYLYNNLDEIEQADLNESVANAIEAIYGEQTEKVAVQLAHYYQVADIPEKAIGYLLSAGGLAARLSAHKEAIDHFTQGLKLLANSPEASERNEQELRLQISLGISFMATQGWGSPGAGKALNRALEIAEEIGDTSQIILVLSALFNYHISWAEMEKCRKISQRLIDLGSDRDEIPFQMAGHFSMALTLLSVGELSSAKKHTEKIELLYKPEQGHALIKLFGHDVGTNGRSFLVNILWHLGYIDEARAKAHDVFTMVQEFKHPFTLGINSVLLTPCYQYSGNLEALQKVISYTLPIMIEQGFIWCIGWLTIIQGWLLVMQGQTEKGLEMLAQGQEVYEMTQEKTMRCYLWGAIADAYLHAGLAEKGLEVAEDGLRGLPKDANHFCKAELHRLKGELLLKLELDDKATPEEYFLQAIDIAKEQEAKSLELRATISLSRLWHEQGKVLEAKQLLSTIYNWFTEGFDTADLKAAKALLADLSK